MKVLTVQRLQKIYQRNHKTFEAVRSVSLSVSGGEIVAFLGPNGAGKTTTVKMIAGLISPDAGSVQLVGSNPFKNQKALRHIGAVLEGNRNLYWKLTPIENLEYFGILRGLSRTEALRRTNELLADFDLLDKRHTIVQNLSRGMQQKLAFAVALIHHPSVLLLDEPTLALDIEATQNIKKIIRQVAQKGCGILLTTHQLDIAEELADKVAIIDKGSVVAFSKTDELLHASSLRSYSIEFTGSLMEQTRSSLESIGTIVETESHLLQ
ncbi:ABC transporter, ATP-binding protein [Synechococcus sp. PCC 7335]|uniref:ABC transporter ATP-binding protein n=1 Tax=Synechococcus sp. (strain ATCC 29403 / PCC 7335) TaxID=91464 RepID=UPI00017EC0EA|nr:ABC transporter ATP-binding protein [Synechococcus sp. PCC 7335]EDX82364.1 ABC transporter, ATP-binding protein [Synechococcus sp. PCC 7335]